MRPLSSDMPGSSAKGSQTRNGHQPVPQRTVGCFGACSPGSPFILPRHCHSHRWLRATGPPKGPGCPTGQVPLHPNFVNQDTEGCGRGTRPVPSAGTGARAPETDRGRDPVAMTTTGVMTPTVARI